jgi:hypothetical protein
VAQKVLTLLQDDVDGSKASETITFGLDGVTYQIDLNARHAAKLRKSLAPFVAAGRPVGGKPRRGGGKGGASSRDRRPTPRMSATETPVDPSAVRAWAAAHQIKVSPRGRIPATVVAQFREAGN